MLPELFTWRSARLWSPNAPTAAPSICRVRVWRAHASSFDASTSSTGLSLCWPACLWCARTRTSFRSTWRLCQLWTVQWRSEGAYCSCCISTCLFKSTTGHGIAATLAVYEPAKAAVWRKPEPPTILNTQRSSCTSSINVKVPVWIIQIR